MKTKLFFLFFLIAFAVNAQITHDLDWERFALGPATDLTIDVGDTVRWTWTDAVPHNVLSNSGSTETFSSAILTGLGEQYSYTFTMVGVNPYFCGVHGAGNMSGTITVQTLGIDDFALQGFSIYPNPTKDALILHMPNGLDKASIDIYDMLGKRVYNSDMTKDPINLSGWSKGVYVVRVTSENIVQTKKFIKQ